MQLDEKSGSAVPSASTSLTVESGNLRFGKTNLASELRSGAKKLCVVIPLKDEEESIDELYRRLKAVLTVDAPNHEFIFVDDGSSDSSRSRLLSLFDFDQSVSLILFRRNLGKAAALSAGFKRTHADVVVMMDADLQDQPEEMHLLIAKLDEGYDLVTGWKQKRHDPLGKTLPSKLFNGVVGRYFKLNIHDFNCGFKAMRGDVARELTLYGDFHRFIPVFASELGYQVAECVVEHAPRVHGKSKYGMKRLVTGFLDFASTILVTRFLKKPFQFFGPLGGLMLLAGIGVGIYLGVLTLLGEGGHIRPLWVVCAILLLGGTQVMFTGLIGELIVRLSQTGKSSDDAGIGQLVWRTHDAGGLQSGVDSSVGAAL